MATTHGCPSLSMWATGMQLTTRQAAESTELPMEREAEGAGLQSPLCVLHLALGWGCTQLPPALLHPSLSTLVAPAQLRCCACLQPSCTEMPGAASTAPFVMPLPNRARKCVLCCLTAVLKKIFRKEIAMVQQRRVSFSVPQFPL